MKIKSDLKDRVSGLKDKHDLSKHTFTVVSPVAQKVWITFTTWDDDVLPKECTGGYDKTDRHYIKSPAGTYHSHRPLPGGPIQLDPFVFQANSYSDFEFHFNVGDKSNPNDWSVVAWGENGPVYLYNKDGVESSHWDTSAKHRKPPSDSKPAKWDSTMPAKRDAKLTKKPSPKKEVAVRAAKMWSDPKKAFFTSIKDVKTAPSHSAFTAGEDAKMKLAKQAADKYMDEYIGEGKPIIYSGINFGQGKVVKMYGNEG